MQVLSQDVIIGQNNIFLGADNKCLRVSSTQAYNPIPATFSGLPSSLYMYPETNKFLFKGNIENKFTKRI